MTKESEVIIFKSEKAFCNHVKERQILLIQIGNEYYCLTRIAKRGYVFQSKCPHYDHPLQKGHINFSNEVICPWHSYRFDLNTGIESAHRCKELKTFATSLNQKGEVVVVIN